MDDAAAVFGLKVAKQEPKHFDVWEENWDVVLMFIRCRTQWRVGGMGGPIGLDYVAVQWLLSLYEVKEPRAMMEGLQIMEAAALRIMAKRES